MEKRAQADLIWRTLFLENTPISEATRGVIAVLQALGLETGNLHEAREYFAGADLGKHLSRVFDLAGISEVVMTNDPLDPKEAVYWEAGAERDDRFHAVLTWTGFSVIGPITGKRSRRGATLWMPMPVGVRSPKCAGS